MGKGEGFRCRFFAGTVFRDGKGLGRVGAHRRGGGAGGAGEGAGGQGGLIEGDGRGEHPNLLVCGLLDGALKLSHLIHRHVWMEEI